MRSRISNQTTSPIKSPTSWDTFARYVSFGIPSSQELYYVLNKSGLTFPKANGDINRNDYDLLFFPVVWYALRRRKLPAFLSFMSLAKCEDYWHELRANNQTQTTVIEVFLRDSPASISDAVRLMPLWMNIENLN